MTLLMRLLMRLLKPKIINSVAVILSLCCPCAIAASANNALYEELRGRWEGTIAGSFRSQAVHWSFYVDQEGILHGYMGPIAAGMPITPMTDLVVSNNRISFTLGNQPGRYEGLLSNGEAQGTWHQATSFPLLMKQIIFAFQVPNATRELLAGQWQLKADRTGFYVNFWKTDEGMLSGSVDIPAQNIYELPIVDLLVTEEGYLQFSTDGDRNFTGNLFNGVMVGNITSAGRQDSSTFIRSDINIREFNLNLNENLLTQLKGRWTRKDNNGIVFEFFQLENGESRGQLRISGITNDDPILQVEVNGENIFILALSGRSFNGLLGRKSLEGVYRVNNRPYQMTFYKQAESAKSEE